MPLPGYDPTTTMPGPQPINPASGQPTGQSLGMVPGPNGGMIPSGQTAGAGQGTGIGSNVSGAILDAVRALAQAADPKAVTQIMSRITGQQRAAEGGPAQPIQGGTPSPGQAPLGNQFGPTGGAPNP